MQLCVLFRFSAMDLNISVVKLRYCIAVNVFDVIFRKTYVNQRKMFHENLLTVANFAEAKYPTFI